jgi:hypothetical protein
MRWKLSIVVVVVLTSIVVVALLPFETIVVPEWNVKVLDEHGNLVSGVAVRESWGDLSIEPDEHEELRVSDTNGNLSFPVRTIKASLLHRVVGKTINSLKGHGQSEGPTAYLLVSGPYKPATSEPYYQPGKSMAPVIVVRGQ